MSPRIAIYSTAREPNYCSATIADMRKRAHCSLDGSITVYVSGSSADYLAAETVNVVERDVVIERAAVSPVHCASLNMSRAIAAADADHPLYLCEDDLNLAENWLSRAEQLSAVISGVRKATDADEKGFVLALFFPYGTRSVQYPGLRLQALLEGTTGGGWWQPYPADKFWGNQCLRFSPTALSLAQEWLSRQPTGALCFNPDMVLKKMLLEHPEVGLYGCVPSLAQHVGDVTAALSREKFVPLRRAANFDMPSSHPEALIPDVPCFSKS